MANKLASFPIETWLGSGLLGKAARKIKERKKKTKEKIKKETGK